jgi:hypothetical protein
MIKLKGYVVALLIDPSQLEMANVGYPLLEMRCHIKKIKRDFHTVK